MTERFSLTFQPEKPHPMVKPQTLLLSRKVQDGYLSIWPTGGRLYSSQIVMTSKDGQHMVVIRSGVDSERYAYYKKK